MNLCVGADTGARVFAFPEKRELGIRASLGAAQAVGARIRVLIDTSYLGVQLPEQFRGRVVLLALGRGEGAEIGPTGVVASLSFGGVPFQCVLPYKAFAHEQGSFLL